MEGWTVCVEHRGKHGVLNGSCVLVGAEVPRPTRWIGHPVRCEACGDDLDALRVGHGRVVLLDAGTERRHYHPPDRTGDRLDAVAAGLEALQGTLAGMLSERQRARPPSPPGPPTAPGAQNPAPPSGSDSILERYSE
jgi:hypothetical protein